MNRVRAFPSFVSTGRKTIGRTVNTPSMPLEVLLPTINHAVARSSLSGTCDRFHATGLEGSPATSKPIPSIGTSTPDLRLLTGGSSSQMCSLIGIPVQPRTPAVHFRCSSVEFCGFSAPGSCSEQQFSFKSDTSNPTGAQPVELVHAPMNSGTSGFVSCFQDVLTEER